MANIAAAHDLSGLGRCSLATAISVLAAMGHHCCPLPTAILSQQTAFPDYSCLDLTAELPRYLAGWEALSFRPDYLYTGFLGGREQPALLADYAGRHPGCRLLVDPVLGDGGALYPCFDREDVARMGRLVRAAHCITPNLTEFHLLTGGAPDAPLPSGAELLDRARGLDAPRLELVVITGASGGHTACNIVLDLPGNTVQRVMGASTGVSFSGTGDLFASIFCGCIAYGIPYLRAVETAVRFISAVAEKMEADCDPRFGLRYEGELHRLSPATLLPVNREEGA